MLKKLKTGIRYNAILPDEKVFMLIYPEFRMKKFLNGAKWYMPPIMAISILLLFISRTNIINMVGLVATPLFILIILMVSYLHQGKQGMKQLNEAEMNLYKILCKDNCHNEIINPTKEDLFNEVNTALKQGNRKFLDEI